MTGLRGLWPQDRGRLAHYAAAAALAVFVAVEMARVDSERQPWLTAAGALSGAILLSTRDAPFVAPLASAAVLAAAVGLDSKAVEDSTSPFLVAVLFVPWCLGTYNDLSRSLVGLGTMLALVAWVNYKFHGSPGDYLWTLSFVAIAWSSGFVTNRRTHHARVLAERAATLEEEQREAAGRAVAEERERIARELHDVIAHSVSVMTVQAGAVRRLLRPEQERERDALLSVEATGRQALTEMRRLVGLLKEDSVMPPYAPQPGLRTLDSLLATVREAGLPVQLEVEGSERELAPGVDLAAYRVVQEALTNALKYAGPARAWVRVRWAADRLELQIENDGRDANGQADGGHGLVGMRERVGVVGGTLESGPRDGGGFVVRARIPIGGGA